VAHVEQTLQVPENGVGQQLGIEVDLGLAATCGDAFMFDTIPPW